MVTSTHPALGGSESRTPPTTANTAASSSPTENHRTATTTATCAVAGGGPHHYAQESNNSAAACIEVGLYGRAETSLKRALRLAKSNRHLCSRNTNHLCGCYDCTLDGCIVRSQHSTASFQQHQQKQQQQQDRDNTVIDSTCPVGTHRQQDGLYIHRTPIRVKSQGHAMGPALCLAITYNLALTHHLIALQCCQDRRQKQHSSDSDHALRLRDQLRQQQARNARKARDLYKLTYQTQTTMLRQQQRSDVYRNSVESIRFELILLNNLAQVYGLTHQREERDSCLEKLLSTAMVVVDHNVRAIDDGDPHDHAGHATDRTADSSSSSHSSRRRAMRSGAAAGTAASNGLWRIELDGFWGNTLHLVLLPSHAASAA